jgi:hypothetical protein
MNIIEFSQKYFNLKNSWHHILFYQILQGNWTQTDKKTISLNRDHSVYNKVVPLKKNSSVLILAPRFHSKSTIVSFIYPLYLITQNPNIRILVVSANEEIATSFVRQVLYQLENNETL